MLKLSRREAEVLRLRWAGAREQEVASALRLAYSSVQNISQRMFWKLGARNIVEACREGLRRGYLEVPR